MNLIRDFGGGGQGQYSTVRDEAKEEAGPHKRALPQCRWSEPTDHNSYESHYKRAMNLIRDFGGGGQGQYSTVRDEAKEEAGPHKRALPQCR